MKDREQIMRILSARHTRVPLIALLALGVAARADTLRDPTQPANERAGKSALPDALRLEAILAVGPSRVAIVNGKVVRAGELVGNIRVEEILSDGVRYSRGGVSRIARLNSAALSIRSDAPGVGSAQ